MATVNEKMTALADSIRAKSGVTGKLTLDDMRNAVDSIQTGSGGSDQDYDEGYNDGYIDGVCNFIEWEVSPTSSNCVIYATNYTMVPIQLQFFVINNASEEETTIYIEVEADSTNSWVSSAEDLGSASAEDWEVIFENVQLL